MEPSGIDLCVGCNHPFARHYLTFGGNSQGCAYFIEMGRCPCTGFLIRYKPEPPQKSPSNIDVPSKNKYHRYVNNVDCYVGPN